MAENNPYHQLVAEFENIEAKVRSDSFTLPKDWFWHRETIGAIKKLKEVIEKDIGDAQELEKKKILDDSNALYLLRKLQELSSALDHFLVPIEKNKVSYNSDLGKKINELTKEVDYCLVNLITRFRVLEKGFANTVFLNRKKQLLQSGLNIYKNPVLTDIIVTKWAIFEEMSRYYNNSQTGDMRYLWLALPAFNYLFMPEIARLESESRKISPAVKHDYGKNFNDDFRDYMLSAQSHRQSVLKKAAGAVRNLLLLLALVFSCDRTIGGKMVKLARRGIINNQESLELLYNNYLKVYRRSRNAITHIMSIHVDYARDINECLLVFRILHDGNRIFRRKGIFRPISRKKNLIENTLYTKELISFTIKNRIFSSITEIYQELQKTNTRTKRFSKGDLVSVQNEERASGSDVYMVLLSSSIGYILHKPFYPYREAGALFTDDDLVKFIETDKRYFSVEGLRKMGFLTIHVSSFVKGSADSLIRDIENQGKRMICCSTLRRDTPAGTIGHKNQYGYILRSGYIYNAYRHDAATGYKHNNQKFLESNSRIPVPTRVAVNRGNDIGYNELNIRKWTIESIFIQADFSDRERREELAGIARRSGLPLVELDIQHASIREIK